MKVRLICKAALMTALVSVVFMHLPRHVYAQASAQSSASRTSSKDKEEQSAPQIDAETGKILNEAIALAQKEDYTAAQAKLGTLKLDKLSPYEKTKAYQVMYMIAVSQDKYEEARKHLQSAIDAGGMNDQEKSDARFQAAQLYMAQEKWKEGAAAIEEWLKTAQNPNPNAYYLLAAAYYQMEQFEKALPYARKAVEMSEKPQENWITLLVSLLLQNEQFKEAIPVLIKLVEQVPDKKTYWSQLSSAYAQMDDQQNSLAVWQLAHYAGLLNEDSDIRRLSQLHAYTGNPYRGALTLQEGLEKGVVKADDKAYEILANEWITAQEYDKAIGPLQKAAEMGKTGDTFLRLGEVQIQRQDWVGATQALQRGLDKGQLKDSGKAEFLMGVALYSQDKLADARPWFQRAAGFDKHRQNANTYIKAIDAKK